MSNVRIPIPLLTSPLKGEETAISLPLRGRDRLGVGIKIKATSKNVNFES